MFSVLRDRDQRLAPVLDRVSAQIERLSDALLSHLDYEEEQLWGPIGRLSIMVWWRNPGAIALTTPGRA